jgi:membrane fusion protein (multidrug efflux system)
VLDFAETVVDPATGTVTLRATFPNAQGLLLPGMYVRGEIVQQTIPNAFLVPQQGVSRDPQGNATVLIVGPGDRAVQRKVTAERTVGDKWVVTAGLQPGDKVIVEGLVKVKAGQPVKPVPAGSPPTRGGGKGAPSGGTGGGRGGRAGGAQGGAAAGTGAGGGGAGRGGAGGPQG